MANLLQAGVAMLASTLTSQAGVAITYRRGSQAAALTATPGKTTFEIADEQGAVQTVESWDFLLQAADLTFGGGTILPERLDEVLRTDGGTRYTHQVLPFGGEPLYRWCDPFHTLLRVHTKIIKRERL